VRYVLLYESADDVRTKAPAHFPAHHSRLQEFHARGDILMVGTFGDPQEQGSMGIFPTRAAAESFVTATRSCSTASSAGGRSGSGTRCWCRTREPR
jgi:uncharacterized protein YciI